MRLVTSNAKINLIYEEGASLSSSIHDKERASRIDEKRATNEKARQLLQHTLTYTKQGTGGETEANGSQWIYEEERKQDWRLRVVDDGMVVCLRTH